MNSPIQWSFSQTYISFYIWSNCLLTTGPFYNVQLLHIQIVRRRCCSYSHLWFRLMCDGDDLVFLLGWSTTFFRGYMYAAGLMTGLFVCVCVCVCFVLSECLSPLTWTTMAWSMWPVLVMYSWTPPSLHPVSVWAPWFPSAPSRSSPG